MTPDPRLQRLAQLAQREYDITVEEVRQMITILCNYFRSHLIEHGFERRNVNAITTKFRDAGRRSAPWRPASRRVPGRPQDGADGNRRLRWLFEESHKFYATEINATLVEVKYYLQTLSMEGAPPLPANSIQDSFLWLTKHSITPGVYRDPVQLIPMKLDNFVADPRSVQSGHLVPLDRDGRHIPDNTFLMLYRSNQLQGNLTLQELIDVMGQIVRRHQDEPEYLQQNPQ